MNTLSYSAYSVASPQKLNKGFARRYIGRLVATRPTRAPTRLRTRCCAAVRRLRSAADRRGVPRRGARIHGAQGIQRGIHPRLSLLPSSETLLNAAQIVHDQRNSLKVRGGFLCGIVRCLVLSGSRFMPDDSTEGEGVEFGPK